MNSLRFLARTLSPILLAASCGGLACAQPQGGEGGQHKGPPPEALAACKSLAAGQPCNFSVDAKTISGSCWAPEGKPLACRPANAPHGGQGKPAGGASK